MLKNRSQNIRFLSNYTHKLLLLNKQYIKSIALIVILLLNQISFAQTVHKEPFSRSEDTILNAVTNLYDKGNFIEALALLEANYDHYSKDCNVKSSSMFLLLYCRLKKYEKARPFYEHLLRCNEGKSIAIAEQKTMYYAITHYLLQTGQAKKSYPYLSKLKSLVKLSQNQDQLRQLEHILFEVDSATGNHVGAVEHFRNYKSLSDSIFDKKRTKQFAELQLKYNTEKKDKDIKLLTQQTNLQNRTIHNAAILRYIFIISLSILGVFVVLLYTSSRLRQRTNKILNFKQEMINGQKDELKKLLSEKEWLLKEIHHRVKNNLQIVISLLNTQSAYLENEDAIMAIQNSQHRMHSMSLIHQKLYQSDNLASIDMSWYIHELVNYLKECFGDTDKKISYNLDTEPVELDVTQAVPLGLIINEAVSNAIKYAFADKTGGNINISLTAILDKTCQLIITDDGVGLPSGFESMGRESLGMDLMTGLTDQLDGTFQLDSTNAGLTITIAFIIKKQFANHDLSL